MSASFPPGRKVRCLRRRIFFRYRAEAGLLSSRLGLRMCLFISICCSPGTCFYNFPVRRSTVCSDNLLSEWYLRKFQITSYGMILGLTLLVAAMVEPGLYWLNLRYRPHFSICTFSLLSVMNISN